MALDWKRLIQEHAEWEAKNFPNVNVLECLMGVQEELGELTHHRLKRAQKIRGDAGYHLAEERDAIGDMTIYLLGVMHHLELEEPVLVGASPIDEGNRGVLMMASQVGYLNASVLNPDVQGAANYAIGLLIGKLQKYCEHMGWSYELIVKTTWAEVKKRDWVADPVAGVTATPAVQAGETIYPGHPKADPFALEDDCDADD